jgi:predicted Zn-dependent peptidase
VKSFSQNKISEFISRNYNNEQIVFCSVGNIPDEKILKLFRTHFDRRISDKRKPADLPGWNYRPSTVTKEMDTFQNHCIIGNVAFSIKDDRRAGMFLLNNILGGQGLNSRLNMTLRERNGLAYNVESNYNPYYDSGTFCIYFGTDKKYLNKSISIVNAELLKLCNTKMGALQLDKAKKQIKGYLARGYENHENLMLSLGKSLLTFNRIETIEETCARIDAITSSQLLGIANEVFDPTKLSMLIYR